MYADREGCYFSGSYFARSASFSSARRTPSLESLTSSTCLPLLGLSAAWTSHARSFFLADCPAHNFLTSHQILDLMQCMDNAIARCPGRPLLVVLKIAFGGKFQLAHVKECYSVPSLDPCSFFGTCSEALSLCITTTLSRL